MSIKFKKLFSLVAAVTLLSGTIASMTSCGDTNSLGKELAGVSGNVSENGGFVVKKGDYIYFINGSEVSTASNEYNTVKKGALMRIKESEIGKSSAEMVVPMIVGSQGMESGVFVYGDYAYFATPSTNKDMDGEVANSWIDFKSVNLKTTEVMSDYYFRLSNSAANYRFVKNDNDNTIYCLYEEDGALKSYNTTSKSTVTLVKGAASKYFFNSEDATDPNVYYTMNVTYNFESSSNYAYNQVYSVNAAASVSTVSYDETKSEAKYTVAGGKTYTFDTKYMEEANEEAEKDDDDTTEAKYDFNDYTTLPYVNLGTLVLDGAGSTSKTTQFNGGDVKTSKELQGYKYEITNFNNNGVYFTRTENVKTQTEAATAALYYLSDTRAAGWDSIKANDTLSVVAKDSTKAPATAIYFYENGVHSYLYIENDTLYKATVAANGDIASKVKIAGGLSGATLWKTEGDYVYYYGTGANGNSLSRVNYKGTQEDYNALLISTEYKPITLAYVECSFTSWYKPELINGIFYYADAYKIDTVAYNYVNAVKLPATQQEIADMNEKYDDVKTYIGACSTDMQKVLNHYFYTGESLFSDATAEAIYGDKAEVNEHYTEEEKKVLELFINGTEQNENKIVKEANTISYFVTKLGEVSDADKDAMNAGWKNTLRHNTEEVVEEEATAWPTWVIIVVAVGAGILLILLITVPVMVVNNKKKARRKAEATVNAYKRKKIDTTDDKSIDVYATNEETAESQDKE